MSYNRILTAGIKLAEKVGYKQIRRDAVAREAKCAATLVTYHFGTMDHLREMILDHARQTGNLIILGQAMGHRDPIARGLSQALKRRVIAHLSQE